MYRRPPRGWLKHLDFILLDILSMQISIVLACCIRFRNTLNPYLDPLYRNITLIFTIIDLLIAVLFNSYSNVLRHNLIRQLQSNFRHTFIVYTTAVACVFVMQTGEEYSRIAVHFIALFHFALSSVMGLVYRKLRWIKNGKMRSMLVISTVSEVHNAIKNIRQDKSGTIQLVGAVIMDRDMTGMRVSGVPVIAGKDDADEVICRGWVDEVYVRLFQDRALENRVYSSMREMGVTIHIDATAYKNLEGCEFEIERIGDSMVLSTSLKYVSGWHIAVKRCMDIAGGIVGSILALIIIAITAIPIKLQSPGPVLYCSERIGRNGKRFTMFNIFEEVFQFALCNKPTNIAV